MAKIKDPAADVGFNSLRQCEAHQILQDKLIKYGKLSDLLPLVVRGKFVMSDLLTVTTVEFSFKMLIYPRPAEVFSITT